jgi:hypothetical protein
MMYKQTSDSHDYLKRVGSHSTKAHPTGRIDDIPAWAADPEQYYNTLRDQYTNLINQLHKTEEQLVEINRKFKIRLPLKEFDHLRQHKERLGAIYAKLQSEVINLRPLVRALGAKSWTSVFYEVAFRLLNREDFKVIAAETRALLQRDQFEIRKGQEEDLTPAQRAANRRRERRQDFHNYRSTQSVVVWSDEGAKR